KTVVALSGDVHFSYSALTHARDELYFDETEWTQKVAHRFPHILQLVCSPFRKHVDSGAIHTVLEWASRGWRKTFRKLNVVMGHLAGGDDAARGLLFDNAAAVVDIRATAEGLTVEQEYLTAGSSRRSKYEAKHDRGNIY